MRIPVCALNEHVCEAPPPTGGWVDTCYRRIIWLRDDRDLYCERWNHYDENRSGTCEEGPVIWEADEEGWIELRARWLALKDAAEKRAADGHSGGCAAAEEGRDLACDCGHEELVSAIEGLESW